MTVEIYCLVKSALEVYIINDIQINVSCFGFFADLNKYNMQSYVIIIPW